MLGHIQRRLTITYFFILHFSEFEKEVKDYIAMVDEACKTADESTLREMEKNFVMSCKLEHMFWDQAQNTMEWPKIA